MKAAETIARILESHTTGLGFESSPGVLVEPQLNYSGRVAVTGYLRRRALSHRTRPKVGLFDVKIMVRGEGLEHERTVLLPAVRLLTLAQVESVFLGESPSDVATNEEELVALGALQAAMAEQEVNWGNEEFQCRSYFSPPSRRSFDGSTVSVRPRDLLTGYVRKCMSIRVETLEERAAVERVRALLVQCRRQEDSRSSALQPQMKGKAVHPDWERFHSDPSGKAEPWLSGQILEKFRSIAAPAPANPNYNPRRTD